MTDGDRTREGSASTRRLRHAAEALASAIRGSNQPPPEGFPDTVLIEISSNVATFEEIEDVADHQVLAHARSHMRKARRLVVNDPDDAKAPAYYEIERALNAVLAEIDDRLDALPRQERLALQPPTDEPQLLAPREAQERQVAALQRRIERLEGGARHVQSEFNLFKFQIGDIRVEIGRQIKVQLDALIRNSLELKAELFSDFINIDWVGLLANAVRRLSEALGATADLLGRATEDLSGLVDAVRDVRRLGDRVADGGRTMIRFVHRLVRRQVGAADPVSGPLDPTEIVELLALDTAADETRGSGRYGEVWRLPLSHEARATLGDRLAGLGDPRPGLGLRDGLPDIDWCRIEGGDVTIETDRPISRTVERFSMARYPVTITQFQAFVQECYRDGRWQLPPGFPEERVEAEPPAHKGRHGNHPADSVSWYDAMAFCHWLSARLGVEVRLPTEFEWQLAATGGDRANAYPWGRDWDPQQEPWRANTHESGLHRPTTVGMYPLGASKTGILDMAGTVWEWCRNTVDDPDRIEVDEPLRVLRGGYWYSYQEVARCAGRGKGDPFGRYDGIGFRVVCSSPITYR